MTTTSNRRRRSQLRAERGPSASSESLIMSGRERSARCALRYRVAMHPLRVALCVLAVAVSPQALAKKDKAVESNPLLQPWSGPYGGVPPWDKVKPELFTPAFDAAI